MRGFSVVSTAEEISTNDGRSQGLTIVVSRLMLRTYSCTPADHGRHIRSRILHSRTRPRSVYSDVLVSGAVEWGAA
eukprot:IDg18357t1